MSINSIKTAVVRTAHKTVFTAKKYSPEILLGMGIMSGITCVVLACKGTTKATKVVREHNKKIDDIRQATEMAENPEEYTSADIKKDTMIVKAHTGLALARVYAPAVAFGTMAVVELLASHHIIRARNVALVAAYNTLDGSYKVYRSRVIDKYGQEADDEIRLGLKSEEVEVQTTDTETGEVISEKQVVQVADPNLKSPYAVYFDKEHFAGWVANFDYCEMFLRGVESCCNTLLDTKGYLFLNEVFEALGGKSTRRGQVVGWMKDPNDPNCDNHIDFRMRSVYRKNEQGVYERVWVLDFNVDGVIIDKIDD